MYWYFKDDQFIIQITGTGKEYPMTRIQALYMLFYMQEELKQEIEDFNNNTLSLGNLYFD